MNPVAASSAIGDVRAGPVSRLRTRLSVDPLDFSWWTVAAFLAPVLIMYFLFTAYPVAKTFYNSFFDIVPNVRSQYVGLEYYQELLTRDRVFWKAVRNTVLWATVQPVIEVGIGLLLALFLYSGARFTRTLRVIWFTPVLLSYVVVAIIWSWIYNYDWGIVNTGLRMVGLDGLVTSWLGNPKTALWSVMFTQIWMWTGFNMVVCLAAISALPSEVIEAGELDNCGWFQKLWFIVVPMIRPTLINLLTLSVMGKMRIFDLVWIMTGGGPLWSTETVATYVYKRAFDWSTFNLGYPSAIATIWFLVVLTVVIVINVLLRQRDKLEY